MEGDSAHADLTAGGSVPTGTPWAKVRGPRDAGDEH